MSQSNFDYRVICDRSGFKAWRSECRKEWDGKLVLKRFWRRRNPLDFPSLVVPTTPIADPRPEGTDQFVTVNQITAANL